MPSICQGTWDCQICPKAVSNAITHVIYQRGFHKPAQKCEENLILFLMKGEILVNSKEYAGTMLKEGEFILQAIGSMFEMLAMTECECIYYRFIQPEHSPYVPLLTHCKANSADQQEMPSSDWLVWVLEQGLSEKWEMIIMENFFVKICRKIRLKTNY